jgi:hypothetical protein
VFGVCGRDGSAVGERRGTGSAPTWVRLGGVTSSDAVPNVVSGSRRRARAGAARRKSVRVRLTPDEATVIGAAAARAGMSVGAWVGDTAVCRARAEAAGDGSNEAGGAGLWSGRELVAALVALRAEVAALRRAPVPEINPAGPAGELYGQPCTGIHGWSDQAGVVEVLRRIDAVTAVMVEETSSAARWSSHVRTERPRRS